MDTITDNMALNLLVGPFHDAIFGSTREEVELSIILPCLNGFALTELTLSGITQSIRPENTEIIVIDDGSTDFVKFIEHAHPEITCVIRHKTNKGFPPSVNDGIKLSNGRYVAIFNNDLVVPNNWYISSKEAFETYPTVKIDEQEFELGVVSCCLISHGGTFFDPPNVKSYQEFVEEYLGKQEPRGLNIRPLRSGGPWVMKRGLFNVLGLYDERFAPGTWEDIDWWSRMVTNGFATATLDDCFAFHFHSQTMSTQFPDIKDIVRSNKFKFCEKWEIEVPDEEIPDIDWKASILSRKLVVVNATN
jgi:O-antigen biosynthesis protein